MELITKRDTYVKEVSLIRSSDGSELSIYIGTLGFTGLLELHKSRKEIHNQIKDLVNLGSFLPFESKSDLFEFILKLESLHNFYKESNVDHPDELHLEIGIKRDPSSGLNSYGVEFDWSDSDDSRSDNDTEYDEDDSEVLYYDDSEDENSEVNSMKRQIFEVSLLLKLSPLINKLTLGCTQDGVCLN